MKYVDTEDNILLEMPPMVTETLTPKQAYERMEFAPESWRYVCAPNKLYKREIFDRVRFRYGRLHEDEFFVTDLFRQCRAVAATGETFYWDVRREGSIMISPMSVRRLDAVDAFVERYDYFHSQGWRELARSALNKANRLLWKIMDGLDAAAQRQALSPRVRAVALRQLKELDMRGPWLWLGYLRRAYLAGRKGS